MAVIVLGIAFWLIGWTSMVTGPGDVRDPVQIVVISDQLHRGLLLPQTNGGFVEFGFGDWSWYAQGHDEWYRVFPTVLWPTDGALSRRAHVGNDVDALSARRPWAHFAPVTVERKAADALRARLEAMFAAGGEPVYQSRYAMSFVPMARGYWFADNCCDTVAEWLVELECDVSWVPLRCDLRVQ